MMAFTNPLWLWALTGLLVPVSIHLLSRKEGKTIYIGSLRHLVESDTAQFSSIRLNEVALLLLRCLLITLLVLLLAGLTLQTSTPQKWLVLEHGIEKEQALKPLVDSLMAQGYETRHLLPGFPLWNDDNTPQPAGDYWALAEALAATPRHNMVVISYNYLTGFKGGRIAMPPNVRWITHTPAPQTYPARAIRTANDSLWVRIAHSTTDATALETQRLKAPAQPNFKTEGDSIAITPADTIAVSVFYDAAFENDATIIQAGIGAIREALPQVITTTLQPTTTYKPKKHSHTVWLSNQIPPAAVTIAYSPCAGATLPLLVPAYHIPLPCATPHSGWALTKRLTVSAALEGNLTVTLATILADDKSPAIPGKDKRTLPQQAMWAAGDYDNAEKQGHAGTHNVYLAIALLLTMFSERWLAYKRNQ